MDATYQYAATTAVPWMGGQAFYGGAGLGAGAFGAQPWTGAGVNIPIQTGIGQPWFGGAGMQPWQQPGMAMGFGYMRPATGLIQPRVELSETNSDVVVTCELPNVHPNAINLTVSDDSLTLSAPTFMGAGFAAYHRTISLPTMVRSEHCTATYNNGILEIRCPKSDLATRRRVRLNLVQ